jgi:two-component system response regulator YesN
MLDIAVVDDEERIRLGLAKLIAQADADCRVVGAFESGRELLEQLDRISPDLVITDIKMPQMSGLQLIERVQAARPGIKFAIVSGFDDFDFARQAIRLGVEEYLLKPVSMPDLVQLLARVREKVGQENGLPTPAEMECLRTLLGGGAHPADEARQREAERELERSGLFRGHYAAMALLCAPALSADELRGLASAWNREFRLVPRELGCFMLVAAIGEGDDAGTPKELAMALLMRLPAGARARLGISGVVQGSAWLQDSWRRAEAAMQRAWYEPGSRAIGEAESGGEKRGDGLHALYRMVDGELRPALQTLDTGRAEAAVCAWLREAASRKLAWDSLAEACSAIAAAVRGEWLKRRPSAPDGEDEPLPLSPQRYPDWTAFSAALTRSLGRMLDRIREAQPHNRPVETVKAYIREHYAEELELHRLAEKVYLTPSYLSKLFKTETGETITDYIISVRIERAKEMLRGDPRLKTYEAGERVGYPDPAYFNKLFKKVVGMTPREYRERVR